MPVAAFAVRQWLQPILRSAASISYGVTRLYGELQAVAPGYRYQEFLHDYKTYTTAYERGANLKYVRRDYKPTSALFSEARVGMRKTYKYNVESAFKNSVTGADYSTRSSFVSSDYALTRGEIEEIVRDRLSDIAEDYECDITATLSEAWHREGDYWD
ncbi:hypothetical protein ES708_08939 [subsurface metagenome]